MKKIKFLFFVIILQCSSLYADANLQMYVESVSYEKGELLCYSVAYPVFLFQQGRYSPQPISSRDHLFWKDDKYRRAMLEWMFLSKDAFQEALDSRADESLLSLYTQYPIYLINAEGFNQAIEHCATKYSMDEESLKSGIKEMVLFTNEYAARVTNIAFEVPVVIIGGTLLFRGTWRAIKWLYRVIGRGYRRLRGITSAQATVLQIQRQQFESITRSFFHFTRGEIALELGLLLSINHELSGTISAYYEDVQEEVSEQKRRDRPSTRLSSLPEALFKYRVDESLYTRLETWWGKKIEDYRVSLIQKGLDVQRISETDTQSAEFYIALNEYRVWADMYMVDYWLVKGVVHWFRQQIAANRIIQLHHQRSYEILRTTLKILDLRKRQLEARMEELEKGYVVDANYNLEHLKTIFTILDQSRNSRSSSDVSGYLPYGYCLEMENYKKFVFTDMSDLEISDMQEWQLCRFHQLQTSRRLGDELYDYEKREFRQLLQMVRNL